MRIFVLLCLAFAVAITSCTPSKKSASPSTTVSSNESSNSGTSANDGSSYEKAIVITEKTSSKGISAEYDWLKKNYPGYKMISQSLRYQNSKPYDVLTIVTSDGTRKEVYFDITGFFGKW